MTIDGGSGTNTLALIGTEFADTFVVTAGGIYGYVEKGDKALYSSVLYTRLARIRRLHVCSSKKRVDIQMCLFRRPGQRDAYNVIRACVHQELEERMRKYVYHPTQLGPERRVLEHCRLLGSYTARQ